MVAEMRFGLEPYFDEPSALSSSSANRKQNVFTEWSCKKSVLQNLKANPNLRIKIFVCFARVTINSYDSFRAVPTFYDQINMAGNIAHLRRRDDRREFLRVLDFKQEEKKENVLETECHRDKRWNHGYPKKLQRQQSWRPIDRTGLARNASR